MIEEYSVSTIRLNILKLRLIFLDLHSLKILTSNITKILALLRPDDGCIKNQEPIDMVISVNRNFILKTSHRDKNLFTPFMSFYPFKNKPHLMLILLAFKWKLEISSFEE